MQQIVDLAKALADPARVQALLALREGELCLCQLIDLLALAPSTVSRHMDLLHRAQLVERRKQGRWHYFKLAQRSAEPAVRGALRWVLTSLAQQEHAQTVSLRISEVKEKDLQEVCACYR